MAVAEGAASAGAPVWEPLKAEGNALFKAGEFLKGRAHRARRDGRRRRLGGPPSRGLMGCARVRGGGGRYWCVWHRGRACAHRQGCRSRVGRAFVMLIYAAGSSRGKEAPCGVAGGPIRGIICML